MELRRGMSKATGRSLAVWLASLLLVMMTACGTGGGSLKPVITEFIGQPAAVAPGGEVVLRWHVDNLKGGELKLELLVEGSPTSLRDVSGQTSTTVVVEQTTTYRLVAIDLSGSDSQEVTITVEPEVPEEPEPEAPTIQKFEAKPAIARPGEPVTLSWEVSAAETITIEPLGLTVDATGSLEVRPEETSSYTLTATSEYGTASESVTVEIDDSERLLFLVVGQSNASGTGKPMDDPEPPEEGVMMLTPEFEWVLAEEPTHPGGEHSFLVRFGKEVKHDTGADVYLVPAAVGGSALYTWDPDDDSENFDRAMTLASYASESLGVPFAAVIWYQGESDTKNESRRDNFIRNTDEVLQAFHQRLPGQPKVIFVQLSKRLWTEELDEPGNVEKDHNLAYQIVRERQRLMEAGANTIAVGETGESEHDRPYYYMAVTHDLPMSDAKHISAAGQRVLGERIAQIYLACVHTTCADPPGPRLTQITSETSISATEIRVDISEPVNDPLTTDSTAYDDYFAVFVDGQERTDFTVSLDPLDRSIIRLEFPAPLPADSLVQVRYMPPQDEELYVRSENVVKGADGLPLPAFGMPVESPPPDLDGLRLAD